MVRAVTEEELIRRCVVRFEITALYNISLGVQKYEDWKWVRGAQWTSELNREANGRAPNYIQARVV